MNVLVTGGAGFIGTHLVERLLARGDAVCILDNLSTGSFYHLHRFEQHANFRLVVTEITDRAAVEREVRWADQVYHLAAAVGVRLIVERAVNTIETNILGSEVVLSLCAMYHKPVFLASTSEVYGKLEAVPFREDAASVIGPSSTNRWAYACSKMMDEFLALAYHNERGLPVVIVRFFNTVGPRQRGSYGMVIPRFVQAALRGEPLCVHGTGEQSRCFGYVGDVIRAVLQLMEEPAAYGQVYNIGSDEEVTINELARRVIERSGSASVIERVPYKDVYNSNFEDMQRRVPCLDKVRGLIGYEPTVNLDGILDAVIDYYRNDPDAPK